MVLFIVFVVYTISVYRNADHKKDTDTIPDKKVLSGWTTWQEKNCQSCHQVYGLGGYLGPDLTNIAGDTTKNEVYIRTFIKYGTSRMPDFHLNDAEISNLVAFLSWVNKSGRSRVPRECVTWSGNYNLEK